MNHKKSMRIFWLSLCLLLISGTVIIAVVQYRSHKREAEEDSVEENNEQMLGTRPTLIDDLDNEQSMSDHQTAGHSMQQDHTHENEPVKPANGSTVRYQFELKVINGRLDVYYYHTETLFFHTGIPYSILTVEQRQELQDGKYFVDEQDLYGYLESCTS